MALDWSTIAVASCTLLSSVLAFFGIRTITQHDKGIDDVRTENREIKREQKDFGNRLLVIETEHKTRCERGKR